MRAQSFRFRGGLRRSGPGQALARAAEGAGRPSEASGDAEGRIDRGSPSRLLRVREWLVRGGAGACAIVVRFRSLPAAAPEPDDSWAGANRARHRIREPATGRVCIRTGQVATDVAALRQRLIGAACRSAHSKAREGAQLRPARSRRQRRKRGLRLLARHSKSPPPGVVWIPLLRLASARRKPLPARGAHRPFEYRSAKA